MAEYIDKQAFNYAIRLAVRRYPITFYNGLEVARQIAHDMSAADVAPRCPHYIRNVHDRGDDSLCEKWGCEVKEAQPARHGRWERYSQGQPFPLLGSRGTFYVAYCDWFRCSECGVGFEVKSRYCPNCGARMDKEET